MPQPPGLIPCAVATQLQARPRLPACQPLACAQAPTPACAQASLAHLYGSCTMPGASGPRVARSTFCTKLCAISCCSAWLGLSAVVDGQRAAACGENAHKFHANEVQRPWP